jgi:hypothetical protein
MKKYYIVHVSVILLLVLIILRAQNSFADDDSGAKDSVNTSTKQQIKDSSSKAIISVFESTINSIKNAANRALGNKSEELDYKNNAKSDMSITASSDSAKQSHTDTPKTKKKKITDY